MDDPGKEPGIKKVNALERFRSAFGAFLSPPPGGVVKGEDQESERKDLAVVPPVQLALNDAVEAALIGGDLTKLEVPDRILYYKAICYSVGLNPMTQPLNYIVLNGQLKLYANKNCAEQLRKNNKVSVTDLKSETVDNFLTVVVKAKTGDGRFDVATGVVDLTGLKGNERANAIMKAETKAKRRVTLSLCSLGLLDETEIDSIKGAKRVGQDWRPKEDPKVEGSSSIPKPGDGSKVIDVKKKTDTEEPATTTEEIPEHREVEAQRQEYAEERARLISEISDIKAGWGDEDWNRFREKILGNADGNKMNVEQLRALKKALDDIGVKVGDAPEPERVLTAERNRVGWDAFNKIFFSMFKSKGPDDLSPDDVTNLIAELKKLPDSLAKKGTASTANAGAAV